MKKLLALEEFAQLAISIYALSQVAIAYNYFILVPAFFAPDLFALGYLVSKPLGASLYNFSHHKLVALAILFIGILTVNPFIQVCGLMAYAHSSFDRMIGYGLKYIDSPNHTHLGFIGKMKSQNEKDHF